MESGFQTIFHLWNRPLEIIHRSSASLLTPHFTGSVDLKNVVQSCYTLSYLQHFETIIYGFICNLFHKKGGGPRERMGSGWL